MKVLPKFTIEEIKYLQDCVHDSKTETSLIEGLKIAGVLQYSLLKNSVINKLVMYEHKIPSGNNLLGMKRSN